MRNRLIFLFILVVTFIAIAIIGSRFVNQSPADVPVNNNLQFVESEPVETETTEINNDAVKKQIDRLDPTAIPLGDGKVSNSPKVGYVFSCQTNFRQTSNLHGGEWIEGDTWDSTQKLYVLGSVAWPTASFSTSLQNVSRTLTGNGLPISHTTGIFPIKRTDPAWQYDRNPNPITATEFRYSIPAKPVLAREASCVPMGIVGYTLNGVALYNALDDAGLDAAAHEVQDTCDGHPQMAGQYHYHGPSDCISDINQNNKLIGYALDGFGIYSRYDADGVEYTNADLDACHGITSEIEWDGEVVEMYHYVMTREYPYTIGCFRGTPIQTRAER